MGLVCLESNTQGTGRGRAREPGLRWWQGDKNLRGLAWPVNNSLQLGCMSSYGAIKLRKQKRKKRFRLDGSEVGIGLTCLGCPGTSGERVPKATKEMRRK